MLKTQFYISFSTGYLLLLKVIFSCSSLLSLFLSGERKRKLTAAVLSDHHAVKKGKKGKEGVAGEGDIGAIGRILQKALQRSREKAEQAASGGSSSSIKVIESTEYVDILP
jgi:hypothetical protein